jgi:lipopolysaccharide export system ATP-binding protein
MVQSSSQPPASALPSSYQTLSLSEIRKSYRSRAVVAGVSLSIRQGEVVGLLGPNGAGKTTTFYACVGLISPDSGKVMLGNDDITRLPMFERARRGIGYLPQEPSVFRKLTVEQNVLAILETIPFASQGEREARLRSLLEDLGLTRLSKSLAAALSGGERRRVEITRALACSPSFILLDEPFAGIDPIAIQDIQEIIAQLKQQGIGVLITDHNVRETLGICDRAYILVDGKVLVSGTPETIASDDGARRFYLGENFVLR